MPTPQKEAQYKGIPIPQCQVAWGRSYRCYRLSTITLTWIKCGLFPPHDIDHLKDTVRYNEEPPLIPTVALLDKINMIAFELRVGIEEVKDRRDVAVILCPMAECLILTHTPVSLTVSPSSPIYSLTLSIFHLSLSSHIFGIHISSCIQKWPHTFKMSIKCCFV